MPHTKGLVVSELLFYIYNKLHSTPKDAVVETCVKFYSSDEISAGVCALEKALSTRMRRRNKTGEASDFAAKVTTDIYEKLWLADATASPNLPTFVAADLSRIPRAREDSDSLAITEQILSSLHDMKCRFTRLEAKQMTCVNALALRASNLSAPLSPAGSPLPRNARMAPTAPSFSQLKSLSDAMSVSTSESSLGSPPLRGISSELISPLPSSSAPPSSALLLSTTPSFLLEASISSSVAPSSSLPLSSSVVPLSSSSAVTSASLTAVHPFSVASSSSSSAASSASSTAAPLFPGAPSLSSFSWALSSSLPIPPVVASTYALVPSTSVAPPLSGTPTSFPEAPVEAGNKWRGAQSNRRGGKKKSTAPNRGASAPIVIGKSVNAGLVSWKGAELTVAHNIGRFASGTTSEEISNSLRDKGVEVVELSPLPTKHDRFLSFKLVLKKSQLPIIENEQFWPEGVIIGRFWTAKSQTAIT